MELIRTLIHSQGFLNVVSILAGIGTFISALIAAWTVLEIKRQRRSSYMPDLILEPFQAHWFWDRNLETNNLFEFKVFEGYQADPDTEKVVTINYRLKNIGLGVAKYVHVEWDVDLNLALETLRKYLPQGYEFELPFVDPIFMKMPNKKSFIISDHPIGPDSIDYILAGESYETFKLPYAFIQIYFLCITFKEGLQDRRKPIRENWIYEVLDEFPQPILTVKYQDFLNRCYARKFKLKLNFSPIFKGIGAQFNKIGDLSIKVTAIK